MRLARQFDVLEDFPALGLPEVVIPSQVAPGVRVIVHEADPARYLAFCFGALARGGHVFLGSSEWGNDRWQRVWEVVRPAVVLGSMPSAIHGEPETSAHERLVSSDDPLQGFRDRGCLMIPTGGTGGHVRFAIHTIETLSAAAAGFCEGLAIKRYDGLCVLAPHHVAGLSQVFRAIITGGSIQFGSWKQIMNGGHEKICSHGLSISIVPTQLQRALANDAMQAWLRGFEMVLVGGALCAKPLREAACKTGIRLALSYGMTEAGSTVCVMDTEAVIAGCSPSGRPLPHVELFIRDAVGLPILDGREGRIIVRGPSLCHGYMPDGLLSRADGFATGDRGYLNRTGDLTVLGRDDFVINSGGEKVDPEEVEAVLCTLPDVVDAAVCGKPDPKWGERVVALIVAKQATELVNADYLSTLLRERLAPFQRPKEFHFVDAIPRGSLAKIDRSRLSDLLAD